MTLESTSQVCTSVLAYAGESAVRSIVLALAVALVVGVARVRHARLRLISWTTVLYAAMVMPLLGLVLPAIDVRLLPGSAAITAVSGVASPVTPSDMRAIEPGKGDAARGAQTVSVFAASGYAGSAVVTPAETPAISGRACVAPCASCRPARS